MKRILNILTFILLAMSLLVARGNSISSKSAITIKVNPYYFDIGENDGDLLYKKRSHKRRKIKRKPRRGRDNR